MKMTRKVTGALVWPVHSSRRKIGNLLLLIPHHHDYCYTLLSISSLFINHYFVITRVVVVDLREGGTELG